MGGEWDGNYGMSGVSRRKESEESFTRCGSEREGERCMFLQRFGCPHARIQPACLRLQGVDKVERCGRRPSFVRIEREGERERGREGEREAREP